VPGRTRIVTLSGVDGAGKSSQAKFLQETLERLGYDAVIEWSPAHAIGLDRLAGSVRRMLGYGSRSGLPDRVSPDFRPTSYPAVVVHAWVAVIAAATGLSLWRAVWPHLGRGRIVVFDRYGLDFAALLSYRHGARHNLRFQWWLLRAIAPRTLAGYFLDVEAEAAFTRKEDQYSLAELQRQTDLYRSLAPGFRVKRLDGEEPRDALARTIALDVWRRRERSRVE
jgi:thymidylate kinase